MTELVLSQGFPAGFWPDSELAKLAGNDNLGWWIGHLREAEASIRRHRKRLEALRDGIAPQVCPGCGGPVAGRADAVYCGSACPGPRAPGTPAGQPRMTARQRDLAAPGLLHPARQEV